MNFPPAQITTYACLPYSVHAKTRRGSRYCWYGIMQQTFPARPWIEIVANFCCRMLQFYLAVSGLLRRRRRDWVHEKLEPLGSSGLLFEEMLQIAALFPRNSSERDRAFDLFPHFLIVADSVTFPFESCEPLICLKNPFLQIT